MIDREHNLLVAQQHQRLGLNRSIADYRKAFTSEADLVLMQRFDEMHLQRHFHSTIADAIRD